MGFSPDAIEMYQQRKEQQQRDAHWINEPGWHAVEIKGYRSDTGPARVTFYVENDAGREQEVHIPLHTAALRTNALSSFLGAALGWEQYKREEPSFGLARAAFYRDVIGKRVKIYVVGSSHGRAAVMDWKSVD